MSKTLRTFNGFDINTKFKSLILKPEFDEESLQRMKLDVSIGTGSRNAVGTMAYEVIIKVESFRILSIKGETDGLGCSVNPINGVIYITNSPAIVMFMKEVEDRIDKEAKSLKEVQIVNNDKSITKKKLDSPINFVKKIVPYGEKGETSVILPDKPLGKYLVNPIYIVEEDENNPKLRKIVRFRSPKPLTDKVLQRYIDNQEEMQQGSKNIVKVLYGNDKIKSVNDIVKKEDRFEAFIKTTDDYANEFKKLKVYSVSFNIGKLQCKNDYKLSVYFKNAYATRRLSFEDLESEELNEELNALNCFQSNETDQTKEEEEDEDSTVEI